ncbi:MAG: MlaD family protein [Solirubrobacteraceae bacterium]|nr:MlaD family protein [Solirubrobacteraceae bacterium]
MSVARRPGGRRRQRARWLWLAVPLALVALVVLRSGDEPGRTLWAELPGPNLLGRDVPVRVLGVDVGTVTDVRPVDGGRRRRMTVRIDERDLDLRADARLAVRYRTALGGRYAVDLDPGSAARPLTGDRIAAAEDVAQTEGDDVLQGVSGDTPDAVRANLRGVGRALRGSAGRRLLDTTAPSLRDTPTALRALTGTRDGDLERLVADTAATLAVTSAEHDALERTIRDGGRAFAQLARRREALAASIAGAPAAMRAIRDGARSIDATLPPLDRLVADLRPAARRLDPALRTARPLVDELTRTLDRTRPLLRELRPAVTTVADAVPDGRRLVTGLRPTVDRLHADLLPWLASEDDDLRRPVHQLIGPTFATLAAAAAEYDTHSHVLHFPIQPASGSLTLVPCTILLADPTTSEIARCDAVNEALTRLLGGRP